MAPSIRSDCLKISRIEVGINLEINWLCLCDLAHIFMTKTKQGNIKSHNETETETPSLALGICEFH